MSEHERLQPLSASQREAAEEATSTYQAVLMGDDAARQVAVHLHARGIDPQTASTFRLGVVNDPFPGHGKFVGFLSIPYLDRNGKALGLRFRCVQEHDHRAAFHGKYMSEPEAPVRMFNIRAVHEARDEIHVTEGELDAMILNKIGLPAVAIPGAVLWRNHHRRMLAGFSRVWVWGDPDDAGAEFTQKVTRSLRQAKGVRLRDGDVTDTYLKANKDPNALLELIKEQ